MPFETHFPYWLDKKRSATALYIGCGLLFLLLAYGAVRMEIEPFWIFFAAPIAVLLPVLVRKFPVVLMVALAYVGTFKAPRTTGITVTDPTFVILVLLCAAVLLQMLLATTGAEDDSLRDLFAGQMGGLIAFFLLILVIAISYTYTPAPSIGGDKVLRLIGVDTLVFVAPLLFLRTDRHVRQLVLFSVTVSLILACLTIYRLLHPTVGILSGEQDPTQIGPGLLIGAAALMILYYPLTIKRLFHVILMFCIAVLTVGIAASLSRTAILCLLLVAGAGTVLLRVRPDVPWRRPILLGVTTVILIMSVSLLWLRHSPAAYSKFAVKAEELSQVLQGGSPSGTAGQRYSFSESAWQSFLAKPLLGWGAGGWSTRWHLSDERVVTYPHNFVLEIAAEQGIAGLIPLALLLLAMKRACAKVLRAPGSGFAFIVPVVALSLLGNAVTGQVEDRDMWFWCGTLFALARMAEREALFADTIVPHRSNKSVVGR